MSALWLLATMTASSRAVNLDATTGVLEELVLAAKDGRLCAFRTKLSDAEQDGLVALVDVRFLLNNGRISFWLSFRRR